MFICLFPKWTIGQSDIHTCDRVFIIHFNFTELGSCSFSLFIRPIHRPSRSLLNFLNSYNSFLFYIFLAVFIFIFKAKALNALHMPSHGLRFIYVPSTFCSCYEYRPFMCCLCSVYVYICPIYVPFIFRLYSFHFASTLRLYSGYDPVPSTFLFITFYVLKAWFSLCFGYVPSTFQLCSV